MALDELSVLLARHARPDFTTGIDDLLIVRADRPYAPKAVTYGRILAVTVQGTKRLAIGDRVYDYRAGQYVVASAELPVGSNFTEAGPESPGLGLGLKLDPADVADLLLQISPHDQPDPGVAAGLAVSDASPELLDALLRLVRLLDHPEDVPVLAPLIKREILWRLLTGEQGAMVRQLGLPDSNLSHIARAVRWLRANYTERVLVEDLARIANMSVSAFHRNFHAVTAMSPIQYQKQIRLQEARLQLSARAGDVGAVSRRVGYDSPSQFSREYRRQFGTPPSRDTTHLLTAEPSAH
ncbi:AraC family transcriptional regulator [Cryptosporangium arvum]|uniref:DNA-binding domain-containing protein, AraC-type n=1 Tax=Cryptosporangium arvum DSM 44712 TaxID=927661 RepID=A0A010ZTL5_9ACTN|nr:DNA-binding domain-containing protein, AraC-type [Cryptosporangium arvum DSM 44712]